MHILGWFFINFFNALFESLLENLDFCFGLNVKYLLPHRPHGSWGAGVWGCLVAFRSWGLTG